MGAMKRGGRGGTERRSAAQALLEKKKKRWKIGVLTQQEHSHSPILVALAALSRRTVKLNGRPLSSAETSLVRAVTTTTLLIYVCYGLFRKDIAVTRRLDSISARQS
jgi:hypothetical protein